ncbi:peroxiredoxin family protein [Agarilytica rhodophyticola]|uniref:peroxiredoxin family protein n=1 Tax=Agarilytica rhodophyticola TaxID=1737490 RepID=UPI000B349A06|nr:redoxin domain-containing protein [Agarilytica rhodophyticola]
MKKLIVPLILLNILGGLGSAVMLWLSGGDLLWLGSFLTTFPLPFFLMVLTSAFSIARTSDRLPLIQLLSISGVILFAYISNQYGSLVKSQYVALGLVAFGAIFVQWYVWSFSNYGRTKSRVINIGQALPEMTLSRLDGSQISSSSFTGSKTILVFFRANWCPFCMNQLKEVLSRADELKKSDTQVKFISNQGIKNSQQLSDKLSLPAHFEILQDDDLKAAKALGIADIDGSPVGMSGYPKDTVMATVILLDADSKVTFGDKTDHYRVRPHPDTFLPSLSR